MKKQSAIAALAQFSRHKARDYEQSIVIKP